MDKESKIKLLYWSTWTLLVSICVFYIVHNACWVISDDAIVISRTGSGKAFTLNDPFSFNKSAGRFYPFAYLAYDLLLLFHSGYISPTAHYALEAVFFVVFAVCVTLLSLKVLDGVKPVWKYALSFMVVLASVGRVYPNYLECFSTIWCGYTLFALFLLFGFLFYKKQKWVYGIAALLCINYLCYCGESTFVLPLSMGTCALLFQGKSLTKNEKMFHWLLIGSALLFLLLYSILILPHIQSAYDGSHGSSMGIFENAVRMLWSQKVLLLACVVFAIRVLDMVKNKKRYTFYDNLLLTAAACCCGNFILRLNWNLYYNFSVLLSLPAILYFSWYYLKEKWTLVIFVFLALYLGVRIPRSISNNQQHRKGTYAQISSLSEKLDSSDGIFWYAPDFERDCFELELRKWKHNSLCVYLGWLKHDPDFSIPLVKEFHFENNTIWLTPSENESLFPDDMQLSEFGDLIFRSDGIDGYQVLSKK